MESFSARMCGCRALMHRRSLQTGAWLWCLGVPGGWYQVNDECFGLIDPSACTVRELERVNQWVSYHDDVSLYDPLHSLNIWIDV